MSISVHSSMYLCMNEAAIYVLLSSLFICSFIYNYIELHISRHTYNNIILQGEVLWIKR